MWRELVYSGTLRPQLDHVHKQQQTSGTQLDLLLDTLAATPSTDARTSLSTRYSVHRIDRGLYLGDMYAAKDKSFLLANGITHVLNCAEGYDEYQVYTGAEYYRGVGIRYLGVPGHDRPSWNISVYFNVAAQFIANAVDRGGRVLVHCIAGISRSATLLIAYLMIERALSAPDALRFVFARRRVFPNVGFLHHLAHLERMLAKRRHMYADPLQSARLRSFL